MAAKKGLGKGLDSLITDKVSKPVKPKSNHAADAVMIDINKVEPNREQPRKKFDEDALIELSESIKQFGAKSKLLGCFYNTICICSLLVRTGNFTYFADTCRKSNFSFYQSVLHHPLQYSPNNVFS